MLQQQIKQQIEMGRIDERLVALEIEDEIGVELAGDLGDAISAAGMIAAGADDVAAEALDRRGDARIIGRDDDLIGAANSESAVPAETVPPFQYNTIPGQAPGQRVPTTRNPGTRTP